MLWWYHEYSPATNNIISALSDNSHINERKFFIKTLLRLMFDFIQLCQVVNQKFANVYCSVIFFFFLNIFQDCIQPIGHEMLSWVRLRGINAHSVSPPAR